MIELSLRTQVPVMIKEDVEITKVSQRGYGACVRILEFNYSAEHVRDEFHACRAVFRGPERREIGRWDSNTAVIDFPHIVPVIASPVVERLIPSISQCLAVAYFCQCRHEFALKDVSGREERTRRLARRNQSISWNIVLDLADSK